MAPANGGIAPNGAIRSIRQNPKHPHKVVFLIIGWLLACSRDESATPAGKQITELTIPGAAVMIGAGDIAVCGTSGDEATAQLVDSLLTADSSAKVIKGVFTLGDNAYPSGAEGVQNDFPRCFSPSWGKRAIMDLIHPSPGNHDFDSGSGTPYFTYFGSRAGPSGRGYYSYDIDGWHLVSLNSEAYFEGGSPVEAKEQEDWLRKDLSDHPTLCTMAYFHRPLFGSGNYAGTREMRPLWDIMYKGGVDLVLNGHEHHYERFMPQTPAGIVDAQRGIEEIIVGTGGGDLRSVRRRHTANSVTAVHGYFGVLKLTLGTGEYRTSFIGTDGRIWDTSAGRCH